MTWLVIRFLIQLAPTGRELIEGIVSLVAGMFCLLISYVASERPNSESARALSALGDRLLAVEDGDLVSPAPPAWMMYDTPATNDHGEMTSGGSSVNGIWPPAFDAAVDLCR